MNADVAFFPSVHPWSKTPPTTCLTPADNDAATWSLPSPLPSQNSAPYCCEKMYSDDSDPYVELQPLDAQMDFFHKLGYSTAQVRAVQQKFGPNTDTDKILGELVKTGPQQEVKQGPVTVSVVLPRGDFQQLPGPTIQVPVPASVLQGREDSGEDEDALRPIVIDGSNVAMSHGNKEVFSCLGIQLAVNYFLDRGHTDVTVFVPSWRKEQPRPDVPITDQHILRDLERRKILVFTPSRRVAGKRVVCNDDCFIVKHGFESDGVIVSNDMYRDLQGEKPEWKRFIDERLLMYSFVNNKFMPPDDPLGRHGPTLENFLRKFPKIPKKHPCPYGKKCTYGIKCKFHHPERAKQSNRLVADELWENAKHSAATQRTSSCSSSPEPGQSLLLVEDMAKKLSLGHESSSGKKDHKLEQVKTGHRSSKKATPRKDKNSQRPSVSDHGESHEQLDSGLGSIDSQLIDAPWSPCDYQYGPAPRGGQHVHNVRQHHPPRGSPCSCCSHGPSALGAFHSPHHNVRAVHGPPPYHGYGAYPLSAPTAYSQPSDFQHSRVHKHQQQTYWSDSYAGHQHVVHGRPGERSQWEPPKATQSAPGREERDVVRKKLLAIFSAHLVDAAMDLLPQVMDPQVLVAEILMLQSQNPSLR